MVILFFMKRKKLLLYVILISGLLGCKQGKTSQTTTTPYIPQNPKQSVVYDSSDLFDKDEEFNLSQKIIEFEKATTNQAVVLTIDSIPSSFNIQDYGTKVASTWGVGQKDKNNGLLITISKYQRQVAISTGLGTEQTISDYECKVIIDDIMIPHFKENNYYKGVDKALDSLFLLWD